MPITAKQRNWTIDNLVKAYNKNEEYISQLRNGFIPDALKGEYENTLKNAPELGNDTAVDLAQYSSFFYIHPEKVIGKEVAGSGYINPVITKGDLADLEKAIPATAAPKMNIQDLKNDPFLKERIIIAESPSISKGEVKQLVTNAASLALLTRLDKKHEPNPGATNALYSIEETLKKYSPNIPENEIKAWVYYKKIYGNPMRGWEKYFLKTSTEKEVIIYSKEALWMKNQQFIDVKMVPSDTLIGRKTRFSNEYSGIVYHVIKTEDNELYYVPENKITEKELDNVALASELDILVKEKALCWNDGDYVPIPLYTYGNIYDIQDKLIGTFNAEKNELEGGYFNKLADKFGIDIANWHKGLIETAIKEKGEFLFNNPIASERPFLSKESELSTTFTVKELNPESGVDFEKIFNENKSRRNRWDNYDPETTYTLFEAYQKWFNVSISDTMIEGTTKSNVINYYFNNRNIQAMSGEELTDKDKDEIRLSARLAGEKYYSQFIAEALTYTDLLKLNRLFNRSYNSFSKLNTDKIPVAFETNKRIFNTDLVLNSAQRNGIAFMAANNSGCLAYDVGFGKTLTAIHNLASLLKQGKVKRPLIIVPKQVYNNWIREMFGFWTDGKEKRFEQFENSKFVNGALTGTSYKLNAWFNMSDKVPYKNALVEPDTITLMTYEGMYKMGFSDKLYNELFESIYSILETGKTDATEREISKAKEKVKEFLGIGVAETVIDIDTCGFDYLVIDEAHAFKNVFNNVPLDKEQKNVWRLGGKGTPTKRAVKAFFHCIYIQKKYSGNVNLLTATPFTNSPLEMFSMLSLVGYESLKKYNLQNLYGFLTMFIETQVEYSVNHLNEIVLNTVIKSFRNKNLLRDVLYKHFDYQDNPALAGVKRPCKINFPNKVVSTYLTMTELQEAAQAMVRQEAASYDPKTNRGAMGRALNWAKNNAFSPYLVPGIEMYEQIDDLMADSPKINYTVMCIASIQDWHKGRNEPMSGQVIYSNRGVSLFEDIKKLLEKECGFKRKVKFGDSVVDEVEIITGGGSDAEMEKKEVVKDAFNEGFVKVVIGTSTIKEGVNLQKRGTALYDLDLDWNPSDMKQLEGRIHRQSNTFKFVRIVVPLVQNTLDSFINQKLDEKSKRISSIWDKDNKANVMDDYNAIDPMEIKFALIDDPQELFKMKVDVELKKKQRNLIIAEEKHDSLLKIGNVIDTFKENFKSAEKDIEDTYNNHKAYLRYIKKYVEAEKENLLKTEMDRVDDLMAKININLELFDNFYKENDYKFLFDAFNNLRRKTYHFQDKEGNRVDYGKLDKRFNAGSGYVDLSELYESTMKGIMHPYGEMKKLERIVLTPYGLIVDNDFSEITQKLKEEKDAFQTDLESMKTDEYKAKIMREIQLELEKRRSERGDLSDRVGEFANYNYLLSYPFDSETSEMCAVPDSPSGIKGFPLEVNKSDIGIFEAPPEGKIDSTDIKTGEVETSEDDKVNLTKDLKEKLKRIRAFMPKMQYSIVNQDVIEFQDVIENLHATIVNMPVTYQQDGLGNQSIVFLHYFYGGSDWYITEKDAGDSETRQCFGYAILNEDHQNAEFGYISVDEIVSINKVELDFYWKPVSLADVLGEEHKALDEDQLKKLEMVGEIAGKITGTVSTKEAPSDDSQQIQSAIEMIEEMLPTLKGKEKAEAKAALAMIKEMK